MKTISKLLGALVLAAFFVIGLGARITWKLVKWAAAYFAVRHIARTQIRKALA